jgi:hypothetical protein
MGRGATFLKSLPGCSTQDTHMDFDFESLRPPPGFRHCIDQSPHLQGSAVEIEIRSNYSKTKKTATAEKAFAGIICEQFMTICSKMSCCGNLC